jgi:hypothetical protein
MGRSGYSHGLGNGQERTRRDATLVHAVLL